MSGEQGDGYLLLPTSDFGTNTETLRTFHALSIILPTVRNLPPPAESEATGPIQKCAPRHDMQSSEPNVSFGLMLLGIFAISRDFTRSLKTFGFCVHN